jgi:serpin B
MLNLTVALGLVLAMLGGVPQEAQSVIAGNNSFALDLYNQLRGREGNLFFSPYSIRKPLAMAWAGARGTTAEEMAAVLYFTTDGDRQHQAFLQTRKLLNQPLARTHDVQLYLSANLWAQRGCGCEKGFVNLLEEYYGAGLQEVDFATTQKARQTINAWVARQTDGKIRELFGPDSLSINTRLVLASAIYFKGNWVHPFPRNRTATGDFRLTAGNKVSVPMMSQTETFGYYEDEHLQVLQMPYAGKNLAMLVLLPKSVNGLANLEAALTAPGLVAWVVGLREQKVRVELPKFKLTAGFALNDPLQALGMTKAFVGGQADFSGINGGREPLFLSAVVHKAFVDVTEEGTEAAAATGAEMATLSLPSRPAVPVFRADHPFVFAIRDLRTGVVLFLGRVVQP